MDEVVECIASGVAVQCRQAQGVLTGAVGADMLSPSVLIQSAAGSLSARTRLGIGVQVLLLALFQIGLVGKADHQLAILYGRERRRG